MMVEDPKTTTETEENPTAEAAEETTVEKPKKRGRPKGSKNRAKKIAVVAARCKRCGKSTRGKYFGTPRTIIARGEFDGKPYNRVTFRRCRCGNCGQVRIEQTFELI